MPQIPERSKWLHTGESARRGRERQQHQNDRQQQEPHENQRDPQPEAAARLFADTDYRYEWNHFNASSSRIASCALISPLLSRSRTSARDGAGLVSTNSRLCAIRLSRDLMVG